MSASIAGAGTSHVNALRHDQESVRMAADEKLREMQRRTDEASTKRMEETLEAVRTLMAQNAALQQTLIEKEEKYKTEKTELKSTIMALVARLEAVTEAQSMAAKRTDDLAIALIAMESRLKTQETLMDTHKHEVAEDHHTSDRFH